MNPNFNFKRLDGVLKDFYKILNIRMSVFDTDGVELYPYPQQLPKFCQCIRSTEGGAERCRACDRKAMEIARERREPYIYTCHAGLTEAILALRVEEKVLGYIFLSHMLPNDMDHRLTEHILQQNIAYGVPEGELRRALASVSVRTTEQILAATHVLEALVSYIYLNEIVMDRGEALPNRLRRYIQAHLTEELNCQRLCREFRYSRTKIYKTFSEAFGMGINEYIHSQRIQRAQKLLSDGRKISEVAEACGYSDYNYFLKIFRKYCGLTPKEYQKKQMGQNILMGESHG